MEQFWDFYERKEARERDKMCAFWRRQDSMATDGDPLASFTESVAPSAETSREGSESSGGCSMEREYHKLVSAGASDEELLEWATCTEEWDFVL